MKLKYIDFILENCDVISIEGKYIGDFLVDNIQTSISRIACNAIEKMEIAKDFAIEIHKDANKCKSDFEWVSNVDDEKYPIFDRFMKWRDITSIEFELEDEYSGKSNIEHYHYYVNWTGDSDMVNESQEVYISNLGNCYIVISEHKNIDDFFDRDQINDEAYMDFCFAMYNIGDQYSNPDRYEEVDG